MMSVIHNDYTTEHESLVGWGIKKEDHTWTPVTILAFEQLPVLMSLVSDVSWSAKDLLNDVSRNFKANATWDEVFNHYLTRHDLSGKVLSFSEAREFGLQLSMYLLLVSSRTGMVKDERKRASQFYIYDEEEYDAPKWSKDFLQLLAEVAVWEVANDQPRFTYRIYSGIVSGCY